MSLYEITGRTTPELLAAILTEERDRAYTEGFHTALDGIEVLITELVGQRTLSKHAAKMLDNAYCTLTSRASYAANHPSGNPPIISIACGTALIELTKARRAGMLARFAQQAKP